MKCLKCDKDVKETGIGYAERGEMIYDVSLDVQGDLQWEQDEMIGNGQGYFFCRNCGTLLEIDEEAVIKILKE